MPRLLLLVLLLPLISIGQVVIKPGQSTVVTAEPCAPAQTIIIRDTVFICPPTPPVVVPPPSTGTRNNIVFEALFNGSNPFPTSSLYKQACCNHSVTQSKTIVREGDGSFRAESRATDGQVSGGYRPEFIPPTNTRLVDGWYGYSLYFEDWKACSSCGEHVMQWHPDNGSGSAVLAIYTDKATFHVRLNPEGDLTANTVVPISGVNASIIPNKWYDIVFHVVYSSDKTKGRIEMWIDGSKYIDFTGVTLTMSSVPYFKVGGINRWNLSGINRVMYTDAVRIGSAKATYKDVAPDPNLLGVIISGSNSVSKISDLPILICDHLYSGPIDGSWAKCVHCGKLRE